MGWNVLPGCSGDLNRPTTGVLGCWKSDAEAGGCIAVVDVGVGYADAAGYVVVVLGCDVEFGTVDIAVGMPRAFKEDVGIGAECRCAVVFCCDDDSVLIG
jgi:hypothetical protein